MLTLARRLLLPIFAKINPGDITIKNHYTGDALRLHSFQHKGYWFYGRRREAATMGLFQRLIKPGTVVAEVGGHIGYITQFFAGLAGPSGKVFVFEPGPNNLPYLRANVGSLPCVEIIEAGVGSSSGEATLYMESLTGQNNSFVSQFGGLSANARAAGVHPDVQPVTVEMTTLDAFFEPRDKFPEFIKVDVEGYELAVLQGSTELLETARPMLMVELQANYSDLEDVATTRNYQVFDEALAPYDWSNPQAGNTFWFHRETHADLLGSLIPG